MRFKVVLLGLVLMTAGVVFGSSPSSKRELPPQDAEVLRFVSRAMAWGPTTKFKILSDVKHMTPSGSYRLIQVERSGSSKLDGRTTLVIDEPGKAIWFGNIGALPSEDVRSKPDQLKDFVGDFIPEIMMKNMRMKVEVDWNVASKGPSALLSFDLVVETGYGTFRRPGAVTVDGELVLLGAPLPYDQDPVAYRKELFEKSDVIMWDHEDTGAVGGPNR